MKLIIAGSRDLTIPLDELDHFVRTYIGSRDQITEVVSGTATGMDTVGANWAKLHSIPVREFPPDWKRLGKSAGPIRNGEMGDYADAALVVHNGSRGSQHMIEYMKRIGKKCVAIDYRRHQEFLTKTEEMDRRIAETGDAVTDTEDTDCLVSPDMLKTDADRRAYELYLSDIEDKKKA